LLSKCSELNKGALVPLFSIVPLLDDQLLVLITRILNFPLLNHKAGRRELFSPSAQSHQKFNLF